MSLARPRLVQIILVLVNLLLAGLLTLSFTQFSSVENVLSANSWGAGTPSSSYITAFATLCPWWWRYAPEAVRTTETGGIEPLVVVPRDAIENTGNKLLPARSVGYYSLLGALTFFRSLSSPNLVYDYALFVRSQQFLLVVSSAIVPLLLYLVHPYFRTPKTLFLYNFIYLIVLSLRPNAIRYLTEGIIDNSLANPYAILSIGAFFVFNTRITAKQVRPFLLLILAGLFCSFCTLIRGEFLFVFLIAWLFYFAHALVKRSSLKRLATVLVLLASLPLLYGIINKVVFGHFVPLRMQSGQNLYEPIGQYPNPYGIQYDDGWLGDFLNERGMAYLSFEADRFLTKAYFELLARDPSLFLRNLSNRLEHFSSAFELPINIWTILGVLALALFLCHRDERLIFVSIPLILAIGFILFFGWTNNLFRLITPVHFLVNIFLCYFAVYLFDLFWIQIDTRRIGRRFLQLMSLPLPVFLSKVWRKMLNWAGMMGRRWRALFFGTTVSDAKFLRSLAGQFASLQSFLTHLLSREEPRFFLEPGRRHEFVRTIRTCCPQVETRTVAAADRACEHIFDLLGSGPTYLGERIDWHVDFKTGHRFDPGKYYADVQPAPNPGGYDIKVPWELSRCQHFAWLGQAYWFTDDERYPQEFVAQVLDWVEQNPPQFGVNWACTMDVAMRAVNWLWGYYFFQDSTSLTDEFRLAFFKSLLAHGRHIMRNLEWSETLTSNHYLSNIVSLVYLGILWPEFKEARRWREFGLQELEDEMLKQVYPDGVDFEASVSYHRLVTELFLSTVLLAQLNGHTFGQPFMARLEKMLEFTMYVTKPDGTVPLIGDSDNGRLHRLKVWGEAEREWVDHRYLLAIGAVLFERGDLAQAAGDQWEEAIWLFGEKALLFKRGEEAQEQPPLQLESRAFLDAGLYVMRHDDLYMVVDAGLNGQNGNGGHAHNDSLSFELYAYGQAWLIDPGTYIYTADYASRNLFRSSAYHNTVVVDAQEINPLDQHFLFSMPNELPVHVHRWVQREDHDFLDAAHHGYRRLPGDVIHRRQIRFDKQSDEWILRDLLAGNGRHTLFWYFHLPPEVAARELPEGGVALTKTGQAARLMILPAKEHSLSVQLHPGWVSPAYGVRKPTTVLEFRSEMDLPTEVEFSLHFTRHLESFSYADSNGGEYLLP